MGKVLAFALAGIGLLAACSDDGATRAIPPVTSKAGTEPSSESVPYGWSRPVTTQAFPDASSKLGHASSAIDGHSLHTIVSSMRVRVRGDDQSCGTCHSWAPDIPRATFCELVPKFVAEPTSKGDGHDPMEAKPLVLKDLLDRWYAAGCPD